MCFVVCAAPAASVVSCRLVFRFLEGVCLGSLYVHTKSPCRLVSCDEMPEKCPLACKVSPVCAKGWCFSCARRAPFGAARKLHECDCDVLLSAGEALRAHSLLESHARKDSSRWQQLLRPLRSCLQPGFENLIIISARQKIFCSRSCTRAGT